MLDKELALALLGEEGSVIAERITRGWFRTGTIQYRTYCIQYQFQILKNEPILKSDDPHIEMLQEFIPFIVLLAANQSLMLRPVQFHSHAEFWTIKVDNIRTYSVLPSKFLSVKLRILKALPKSCFGRGRILSEPDAIFLGVGEVVNKTSTKHAGVKYTLDTVSGTTPRGIRFAIPLPSSPRRAIDSLRRYLSQGPYGVSG